MTRGQYFATAGPPERTDKRHAAAEKDGLFFLLGGGAVARVPSLVASCAPLLTPFCATRASFLTPFRRQLRRSCRRSVPDFAVSVGGVVGVAGAVVVWASASDTGRIADDATSPNVAAYPRKARAFRRQTRLCSEPSSISCSRFAAPLSISSNVERLAVDLNQPGRVTALSGSISS